MIALALATTAGRRATPAWVVAVVAAILFVVAPATAFAKYEPPPLRGAVVDAADALDANAEAELVARLDTLRRDKGFAIVVFLPKSLDGLTVEDVAYDTFNTWGVGASGKDDGVLLVVAPNDRKMRIETGKGVGDRLTDVQSSRILRELMAPRLQRGDVVGAVDAGTRAIERALTGEEPVPGRKPTTSTRTAPRAVPLTATQKWVLAGVVAAVLLLAIVSRGFRRVLFSILEVLLWAAFFGRGGRGGGGGGGGDGGYGGGGGRSGGGGASGGW